MRDDLPAVEILGVRVARLDPAAALAEVARLYEEEAPSIVAYVNAHTLNLAAGDLSFREVLGRAALVLNDGAGIAIAGRIQGRPFPANLNGSDFNPLIARLAADRGWPLFLLGARPGVAEAAARRLGEQSPGVQVAGVHHGYFDDSDEVVRSIRESGARVLMVAMGNPRQELWLGRHLGATGCRFGVGVGAFFDFTAGTVRRAPRWLNRVGLEWLFRLVQEPGRMWRRYVIGNPLFVWRVLYDRVRASRIHHRG